MVFAIRRNLFQLPLHRIRLCPSHNRNSPLTTQKEPHNSSSSSLNPHDNTSSDSNSDLESGSDSVLDSDSDSDSDSVSDSNSGHRILDISYLNAVLMSSVACASCNERGTVGICSDYTMQSGISVPMCLTCTACGQSTAVETSKLVSGDRKARREELTTRAVLAMQSVGCGHSGLRKFCGVVDLPPPLSPSNYQKHAKAIHDAAKQEAEESMNLAVRSLRTQAHIEESETLDISVSCDGTWARRGFTLLHGVVVVASLETGQIVDCEVLSKTCYTCKRKAATKPDLKSSEFQLWYESHLNECQANCEGSSPAMESAGAEVIWSRSLIVVILPFSVMVMPRLISD